jgi:uncharacterized phage-like protein YoqJ
MVLIKEMLSPVEAQEWCRSHNKRFHNEVPTANINAGKVNPRNKYHMYQVSCPDCELVMAATGHRPPRLGVADAYHDTVFWRLVDLAKAAVMQYNPFSMYSGMALGWDQAVAEACIQLGVPVIAAIPFEGQETPWPEHSQERYRDLVEQCDTKLMLAVGGYSGRKMMDRNRYMVDRAVKVLALWDGGEGGTANTVGHARRNLVPVVNLWYSWSRSHGLPVE